MLIFAGKYYNINLNQKIMTKTLRFSLLSMLMMLCGSLFADNVTVTFTAGTDQGAQTNAGTGADEMSKDGITISVTKGALAAQQYRTAKGETMTITSSIGNITKVVFNCTASGDAQYGPGNFTGATSGSYTYDDKIGTWTGNASSFSLTASGAQVRATSIVVTVGEGSGTDPDPDPQPDEVKVVTIAEFNDAAESTSVWYQLSGTVKNLQEGDEYGNFDLEDETASVYVYGLLSEKGGAKKLFQELAAEKGIKNGTKITLIGNRGSYKGKIEVTNAYLASVDGQGETPDPDPEMKTAADIAAFKALAAKTEAELTLKDAEVLYVNGTNDIYVRDASGAIDFYRTGLTYTAGQKLNGSVIGILDAYNNTPELVKSSNTNSSKITASEGTVTAKSINAADAANYICDLVKISGATLTENGGNYYVGDVQVYDKFKVVKGTPESGKSYDIEGIVIMYNDVVELCPTSDYTEGEVQPDVIEDATIAEFNAAAESTTVWYRLKGEVKNLKDGDQYGNFDLEDETGSVYVYGLLSEKGGAQKQFQELAAEKGIKNGCKITIIGNRGSYKDQIEVTNAYFVSVDEAAPAELVISGDAEFTESTTVTITPSDEIHDVYYTLDGSDPSDMAKATRYMGPFTITETCTVRAWEEDVNLFAEKTFTKAEPDKEYTVEEVIAAAPESTNATDGQQKVWVKGYIVGFVNGQALATGAVFGADGCETKTNLLLATDPAETNVENCIPVQLPAGNVRDDLNLQDHADNYGKEVLLYGYILKYFSVPGFKNVSDYKFTGNSSVEIINAENVNDGKMYNLAGQRVNGSFKGIVIKNGKKFLVK